MVPPLRQRSRMVRSTSSWGSTATGSNPGGGRRVRRQPRSDRCRVHAGHEQHPPSARQSGRTASDPSHDRQGRIPRAVERFRHDRRGPVPPSNPWFEDLTDVVPYDPDELVSCWRAPALAKGLPSRWCGPTSTRSSKPTTSPPNLRRWASPWRSFPWTAPAGSNRCSANGRGT